MTLIGYTMMCEQRSSADPELLFLRQSRGAMGQ